MKYLLYIILHTTIGIQEQTIIQGDHPLDLPVCLAQGEETKAWLTQDFIEVTYLCLPYPQYESS